MTASISHNLDYVAAQLHGRRSRMAQAQRLEALCRLRTLAEFSLALYPGRSELSITTLQHRLVEDLVRELQQLIDYLPERGGALLEWIIVRFELENLKILVRACVKHQPVDKQLLVPIPKPMAIDSLALTSVGSLQDLIQQMSPGPFRAVLEASATRPEPFFTEAALDHVYFGELLQKLNRLGSEDRETVSPIVMQEVDLWQTVLALRARFTFEISPDLLLPLHVDGTHLSHRAFEAMLRAQELSDAVPRVTGCVIDNLPKQGAVDLGALEIAGWKRFLRLANQAFRRGPVGLGTVIGYAALRRVEVMNLITISEGIRAGLSVEHLLARLIT